MHLDFANALNLVSTVTLIGTLIFKTVPSDP
jgi:hypothetical protein